MSSFSERIFDEIRTHRLINRRDRVVVSVSGGPDSVALLHLLAGLRDRDAVRLAVAHVHHGLRDEADADAAFVTALAARYDVPAFVSRQRARAEAQASGLSLEDAARRVRRKAEAAAQEPIEAEEEGT